MVVSPNTYSSRKSRSLDTSRLLRASESNPSFFRTLSRSIEYGLAHREAALTHAMRFARRLDRPRADRFVGMYVNDWTRGYGPEGRRAVQLLLDRGHAAGLIPAVKAEYVEET